MPRNHQSPSAPALRVLCGWILCITLIWSWPFATAQEPSSLASDHDPLYLHLDRRPSADLASEDRETLQKQHKYIAGEAALFGYDLSVGDWISTQSTCPLMPTAMILHYRRHSSDRAVSEFTAVFLRDSGRVYVIPLTYRNVTPFHPAPGSPRSITVFNSVIPSATAAAALQLHGQWLLLAACYADMTSPQAYVLKQPADSIALARAPGPTLEVSEINSTRGIIFTNRYAPHQYSVWHLTFAAKGRLRAASATRVYDYIPHPLRSREPRVTLLEPAQRESRLKFIPENKTLPGPKPQ
jgi:hypothetical protein